MKFGKNISEQQLAAPSQRFLDFKALKKAITNVDFVDSLEEELRQCNASYTESVTASREAFAEVSAAADHASRIRALAGASAGLEAVRRCAMWNAIGVIKILKKRAKLGQPVGDPEIWLKRQDFFACEDFAELKGLEASLSDAFLNLRLQEMGVAPTLLDKCPICLEICTDPIELTCTHKFCWRCFVLGPVTSGEYRLDRCPVCRAEQPLDPVSNFILRPPVVSKLGQTVATLSSDSTCGISQFCSLCCEPLALRPIAQGPCAHAFHGDCLRAATDRRQPECPACRAPLPKPEWDRCDCETSEPSRVGSCRGCGRWGRECPPPETLLGPGGLEMPSLLHLLEGIRLEPDVKPGLYWSALGSIQLP